MKLSKTRFKRSQPLLGTYVQIELHGALSQMDNTEFFNQCITEGFSAIIEIDRLMSFHREDSDLTRINKADAGEWVNINPHTFKVLKMTNALFQLSEGVFDIRCGDILMQKGILPRHSFHKKTHQHSLENIIPLELRSGRVRKTGLWILDLGGIAKGYAVDCAVQRMKIFSSGKRLSGSVNAGGDLSVWGNHSFPIGVRVEGKITPWIKTIELKRSAVAVSSVRENNRFQLFAPAAHVKMPEEQFLNELKTVIIFAEHCAIADALTKIVLLGEGKMVSRCLAKYKAKALIFNSYCNCMGH